MLFLTRLNCCLSGRILASEKPSPFRGRWHFCPKRAKMTDEVLPKLYAASGYTSSVAFRRQLHHAALRKQQQRHKELDVPQCLIKRGSLAEHSRQQNSRRRDFFADCAFKQRSCTRVLQAVQMCKMRKNNKPINNNLFLNSNYNRIVPVYILEI